MHRRLARHLLSQSNAAFAETHSLVQGSTAQGRGNFAFAATVSSDSSEIKKSQKRVPKDERKSMVESFVNNYRAMNSGNFPAASTVQKEVGGSYYIIKNLVQELQHKSQMPSRGTRKDTALDVKLHKNAALILSTTETVKNSEVAAKEEDRPHSAIEEKILLVEVVNMPAKSSETTISLKKNELPNTEEDVPTSALKEKTLSDEFATRTLEATIEVKEVKLAAEEADESTFPLQYKNLSEEIAKPSETDDTSAKTANDRYLVKEEAKDSYPATRISENKTREKATSKVAQQQQSSDLANVIRDVPEEHERKPFKWSLKSLAEGFMRMWRRS